MRQRNAIVLVMLFLGVVALILIKPTLRPEIAALLPQTGRPQVAPAQEESPAPVAPGVKNQLTAINQLFLPVMLLNEPPAPPPPPPLTSAGVRVNAPYFSSGVPFRETAVFWFGQVHAERNYADVRVGYNDDELYVHVAVFDRSLWTDPSPSADRLTRWDAVSLLLRQGGAGLLDANATRWTSQFNNNEDRTLYQAVEQGSSTGWQFAGLPFVTKSTWRGSGLNDDLTNDRGWTTTYRIPFSSLGLDGAPPQGTEWALAVALYDKDDGAATAIPLQSWPSDLDASNPGTWGLLRFGLPEYSAEGTQQGEISIRNGSDGAVVHDSRVGGGTTCGDGFNFFTEWGDTPTPDSEADAYFNVQNQHDVGDFPCFSKFYITIPIDAVPAGKTILSATLTLRQFGNSGGDIWGDPPESLIQVLSVAEDWDENTLTWNNAPLAVENIAQTWVSGLAEFPGWPGVARDFDVSRAVAQAYASGNPLRLVIYSADGDYHSGKYFSSSNTPDWNLTARPVLKVTWGK